MFKKNPQNKIQNPYEMVRKRNNRIEKEKCASYN